MVEDNHICLFCPIDSGSKHIPYFSIERSTPAVDYFNFNYGQGKFIDMRNRCLVFECAQIKTEADEKKLRSHDLIVARPGKFIFASDKIMDCLNHLVNRDIQVLTAEIRVRNKVLKGYHLIDVINVVHGVDRKRSTYVQFSGYLDRIMPKRVDFMKEHEMAREKEKSGNIYIVPALCRKLLKLKKGGLKGLELCVAIESREKNHGVEYVPYVPD